MNSKRKPLLALTRRGFQTKHRGSVSVVSPSITSSAPESRGTIRRCFGVGNHSGSRGVSTSKGAQDQSRVLLSGLDTLTITAGGSCPPTNWLIEQQYISRSKFKPIDSSFGHCAANPGNDKNFQDKLDKNIKDLLN